MLFTASRETSKAYKVVAWVVIIPLFLMFTMCGAPLAKTQTLLELSGDGKFTIVEKGKLTPFGGVLLDELAMSEIMAKFDALEEKTTIRLQEVYLKERAKLDLTIGLLENSLESTKKRSEEIIVLKEQEIVRLREIVEDSADDYSKWWFVGGFAGGVVLSVAIFFAASEIVKR